MKDIAKHLKFIILFLTISWGYGQEDVTFAPSEISGSINTGNALVYGPDLGFLTNASIVSANTGIELRIDADQPPYGWYRYSLQLEITPRLANGSFDTVNAYQVDLTVERNMVAGAGNGTNVTKHIVKNHYGAQVVVKEGRYRNLESNAAEDINGYMPENISLTMDLDVESYQQFSTSSITPTGSLDAIRNELEASWPAVSGVDHYQLEWTWVDDYGDGFGVSTPANDIVFTSRDFKQNSTRIQTNNTTYNIPLIYAKGYVIYRVRAVGRYKDAPSKYQYATWSSGLNNETTVASWLHKYQVMGDHEQGKNWQFQASYAEEGKKKEVVSYFDGTLRNRQTVTKINSDDNIVVGEVIYDAQGRPAVEVLPVPTTGKQIKYTRDFNQSALSPGMPYDYTDFDLNGQNVLDQTTTEKKMATETGASKYYSTSNDVNDAFRDRVPDALGHPFSQVEYMPDNTGRIRRKSGVGVMHQLGSGQEMEYYYGTPEQKELNRLFGYSVGNKLHYKKNLVIDPNGQASISYIDPQGRTIATALAGYAPTNLEGLPDEDDASELHKVLNVDLLGKLSRDAKDTNADNNIRTATQRYGALEDALEYAGTKVSPFEENRTFNYTLSNDQFLTYACNENNDVQYPLVYDLSIDVLDGDGVSLISGPMEELVNMEDTEGSFVLPEFVSPVKRGSYSITKSLMINQEALSTYVEQYLAKLQNPNDPCYISPEEVSNFEISINGCFVTCEECEQALIDDYGTRDEYANTQVDDYDDSNLNYLTDAELAIEKERLKEVFKTQWDALVRACNAPCNEDVIDVNDTPEDIVANSMSCSIAESVLMNDMKPLGQYGAYTANVYDNPNGTGQSTSTTAPKLSIYSDVNELYSTKVSDGVHNSWRNPRHPDYDQSSGSGLYENGHYYNEDGTVSHLRIKRIVSIVTDQDGNEQEETTYEPELIEGAEFSEIIGEPDYVYAEPQYLANVSDFLKEGIWQDQWVESLVTYHPEYCYLGYYEAVCKITNTDNGAKMNSDGYDLYLQSIKTYDEAKNRGLLSGFTALGDSDPYFGGVISGFETSSTVRRNLINEALTTNYNGSNKNMVTFSYATLVCSSISSCNVSYSGTTTAESNLTEEERNQFWNTYKANYLTMKQTIRSLFANIYALNNGCYNGCIGPDEAPTTLLTVISDYGVTNINAVEALITGNIDCNDANASLYDDKEKRFKPSDNLYDSGTNNHDIYEDTREFTNYEYYLETGICPLGRDLELFLEYYFKDYPQGNFDTERAFVGSYLSPSLFEDLGGEHPTEITTNIKAVVNNNTLQIRFNQGGTVLGDQPIVVTSTDPSYDWTNYGEGSQGDWVITKIKNIYPTNDEEDEFFEYVVLAEVRENSTSEDYEEIILRGTTQARTSNCSIVTADGIGEYLPSGSSNNSDCNKQPRFEQAFARLLNRLQRDGTINSSVDLSTIPEYANSYMATFFEPATNVTWFEESPGFYVIQSGTSFVLTMDLEASLIPSSMKYITGVSFNYTYNETGKIIGQDVNITYIGKNNVKRIVRGQISENCDPDQNTNGDGGVSRTAQERLQKPGTNGCRLINFLCCGDINDLVDFEEEFEGCLNLEVSCQAYPGTEAMFENYFMQVINEGITNVPESPSFITYGSELIDEFRFEAQLEKRFKERYSVLVGQDGNVPFDASVSQVRHDVSNSGSFEIKFSGSENIFAKSATLKLEFSAINGEPSPVVDKILCLDIINFNLVTKGGGYGFEVAKITYRTNTGSIVTREVRLSIGYKSPALELPVYELHHCEFLDDVDEQICDKLEIANQFGEDYTNLFNTLLQNDGFGNLGVSIPLNTVPQYTEFLQKFLSSESARFYDTRFYKRGVDFSNVDHVYASIVKLGGGSGISHLSFMIHFSDFFYVALDFVPNQNLNDSFELTDIAYNFTDFNNISNRRPVVHFLANGQTYQRPSTFRIGFLNEPVQPGSSQSLAADSFYYDCNQAIVFENYLFQDDPDNLYNDDVDICINESADENDFEEKLKNLLNEGFAAQRENRVMSSAIGNDLFYNNLNFNGRIKELITPFLAERGGVYSEANANYSFSPNATSVNSLLGNSELEKGRILITQRFNEINGSFNRIVLSREEDFYDIYEVFDVKIVKSISDPDFDNAHPSYSFCTIHYKNEQGETKVAKNVYLNIRHFNVNTLNNAQINIYPNLCNLFSTDPGAPFVTKDGTISSRTDLSSKSTVIHGEEPPCGTDICIPPVVPPVSCTDKYPVYEALMNTIGDKILDTTDAEGNVIKGEGDVVSEEEFCNNSLQYLVDDYSHYITKFGITSTLDLNYMTIGRFGATEFNYGYPGMRMSYEGRLPIIDLYHAHVVANPDNAMTWSAWTSDYLNGESNESICVPRPFPVDFGDATIEIPEDTDCEQFVKSVYAAYTRDVYESFIETKEEEFIKDYIEKAMGNAVETFDMKHFDKEYQYTLYYYDQSGNLMQTVPPEGVDRFGDEELELATNGVTLNDAINQHRANNVALENDNLLPDHRLITEYRYNSLNQLVWQKTPDGGITRFAYDELGRIIASQNAKQLPDDRFSYTTYDKLGRIIEAGEMLVKEALTIDETSGKLKFTLDNVNVPVQFEDAYPYNVSDVQVEVTKTAYSNVAMHRGTEVPGTDPREKFNTVTSVEEYTDNTRNRVSAIYYFDRYDSDTRIINYDNAIFYHYDIHGNVSEIAQHNKLMTTNTNDPYSGIKRIAYDYDLISGNVNTVTYQSGAKDQFIHRYEYDADNRIVNVQTSADGMLWEQDASYQYFAHGPLARTELGDAKVQGMDYAYTLQGWLKGVNSENLTSTTDMGGDGASDSTTARDAMGYSLSYYNGDYNAIGGGTNTVFGYSANNQSSKNLYNGNIKQMVTNLIDNDESMLGAQINKYEYDQLNRIKKMDGTNANGIANYSSEYDYDNNGNLESLKRSAVNGNGSLTPMDAFTYNYNETADANGEQQKTSNRLRSVYDNASLDGNFDTDIDSGQTLDNYTYDAIGQLTSDEAEGITDIEWRVDGKVKTITKDDGTTIGFGYDGLGNRISKTVMPENKTTLYVRDAQGNSLAVYNADTSEGFSKNLRVKEHHIYGSSRLGLEEKDIVVGDGLAPEMNMFANTVGDKRYELSNHLGNVLSVITDRRLTGTTTIPGMETLNQYDFTGWQGIDHDGNWTLEGDSEVTTSDALLLKVHDLDEGIAYYMLTEVGQEYTISYDLTLVPPAVIVREPEIGVKVVEGTSNGSSLYDEVIQTSGTHSFVFTATSTNSVIQWKRTRVKDSPGQDGATLFDWFVLDNVIIEKGTSSDGPITFANFVPDVLTYNDYYPFGMLLPNRHGNSSDYRYGFQGQEMDNEVKGEGNSQNFKFRMHNSRIGRFFTVDPLSPKYPHYTPYSFSGNKPIAFGELEGLEEYSATTNGGKKIRLYKVRPQDDISLVSEITGVAIEDILRYTQVPEGSDIVYPQILILEDVTSINMDRFESWGKSFMIEAATSNENGPSVQSQAEAVAAAEGAAALTQIPRLIRSGYKTVKNILSKSKPKVKVTESAVKISSLDDVAQNPNIGKLEAKQQLTVKAGGKGKRGKGKGSGSSNTPSQIIDEINNIKLGNGNANMKNGNHITYQYRAKDAPGNRSWDGAKEWIAKDIPKTQLNGTRVLTREVNGVTEYGFIKNHNYSVQIIKVKNP